MTGLLVQSDHEIVATRIGAHEQTAHATFCCRSESARCRRVRYPRGHAWCWSVLASHDRPLFLDESSIASYLPLISHLRKILAKAHKKSYTISVGKLNPAKLGNFMEIECFVLAACPENSVIESKVRLSVDESYGFAQRLSYRSFIDQSSRHMNWKLRFKLKVHGMGAMC